MKHKLKKNIGLVFQIAAVFIGTVVGAGLASGQEITQFFTTYGYKSFFGFIICCLMYVLLGYVIIELSIKYELKSYSDLITLVNPSVFGKTIDIVMGIFLISSAAIILAGSGALLHQHFGVSKWIGIGIMTLVSLYILLQDTKGLIEINSFIVPTLTIVIVTIFVLYLRFNENINPQYIMGVQAIKKPWIASSILYGGFNIFSCSGVLVPLSSEIKEKRCLFSGVAIGAIGLSALSAIINLLLLLNIPYIFKYEIPLLYIANRFGIIIQLMLLCIIWLEMFSTEVSDIYSVSKTLEQVFKIPYKKGVILIMALAIPISQIGFVNLINILYPAFGIISAFFMGQCCLFYVKTKHS